MQEISWSQECGICVGTGLTVGWTEKNGAAVICVICKGEGKVEQVVTYESFTGRKEKEGVSRVYKVNPGGMILDPTKISGGVSYQTWNEAPQLVNTIGNEIRADTCPAWYYQNADYYRMPKWEECNVVNKFSDCVYFGQKAKCWAQFDKENGQEG